MCRFLPDLFQCIIQYITKTFAIPLFSFFPCSYNHPSPSFGFFLFFQLFHQRPFLLQNLTVSPRSSSYSNLCASSLSFSLASFTFVAGLSIWWTTRAMRSCRLMIFVSNIWIVRSLPCGNFTSARKSRMECRSIPVAFLMALPASGISSAFCSGSS